jgi:23S rRNA pseudouridine1911/1915/1917 synthase
MQILYEDNHLIAINKSFSDLVQSDKTGDTSLDEQVKQYIKEKYHKPGNVFLGVIHRLDRPVSGIVLFARTSKALSRMNEKFREGEIKKTYLAIVKNCPENLSGTLTHYMIRNRKKNKSFAYDEQKTDSKMAILEYDVLGKSDRYYLIKVNLKTGRHHQIRSQLAKIGCPIKGDLKYNFDRSNNYSGIGLHGLSVSFKHPVTNEKIIITAEPPKEEKLWSVFKNEYSKLDHP